MGVLKFLSYLILSATAFAEAVVSSSYSEAVAPALVGLAPSSLNCDFYQQLESELKCGPQAYLQKWGIPLCQLFLSTEFVAPAAPLAESQVQGKAQADAHSKVAKNFKLLPELRAWFPQVRLCLQEYLSEQVLSNQQLSDQLQDSGLGLGFDSIGAGLSSTGLTCENLQEQARISHVQCYLQTGFCELTAKAKLQLVRLSRKFMLQDPVLAAQTGSFISAICLKRAMKSHQKP